MFWYLRGGVDYMVPNHPARSLSLSRHRIPASKKPFDAGRVEKDP